jgi:hypothetical protein
LESEPLLKEIESLNERIQEYEVRVEKIARESYPHVELLKQAIFNPNRCWEIMVKHAIGPAARLWLANLFHPLGEALSRTIRKTLKPEQSEYEGRNAERQTKPDTICWPQRPAVLLADFEVLR